MTLSDVVTVANRLLPHRILQADEKTCLSAGRDTPIRRTPAATAAIGVARCPAPPQEGFAKAAGSGKAFAVNGGVLSCVLGCLSD